MPAFESDRSTLAIVPGTPEEAAYQQGKRDGIALGRKQLLVVAVLGKVVMVAAVFVAGRLAWS